MVKFSLGLVVLLSLVYLILVSLALLTAGLHLTFTSQVLSLVHNNVQLIEENDIVGFCVGQLSTALLQSSSVRVKDKFRIKISFPWLAGLHLHPRGFGGLHQRLRFKFQRGGSYHYRSQCRNQHQQHCPQLVALQREEGAEMGFLCRQHA